MPENSSGQITHLLRRLREHGLIKRVRSCCRYYLTDLGRHVAMMALKLREMVIIPSLAFDVAHTQSYVVESFSIMSINPG